MGRKSRGMIQVMMRWGRLLWLTRVRRPFRWLFVPHLRLGRLGEWLSCRALEELGFDILARNVRNTFGEIDIVAREGCILCFVEVKTRHRNAFSRPADAVDEVRRRRLSRAAALYRLQLGEDVSVPYRFDIMEVIFDGWRLSEVILLRNAYQDRTAKRSNSPILLPKGIDWYIHDV